MKRFIHLASTALLLAFSLPFSMAQDREEQPERFVPPSSIVGAWSFETELYRGQSCKMSGNMNINPTDRPNVFNCSFTAIEDCIGQDEWVVEQTCKLVNTEGRLTVKSQIVNFLQSKEYTASYAPDHFSLQVQNRQLMTGSLISAVTAPVTFRRNPDNLS